MQARKIITIDGPSGSGKSTVSKLLSERLAWSYLDSGALYRIVALFASRENITANIDLINKAIPDLDIKFSGAKVFLFAEDISTSIRDEAIGLLASSISQHVIIRQSLILAQRNFAAGKNLVAEGRDMGTTIFPEAQLKVFMTASLEERANRRYNELLKKNIVADLTSVANKMATRDKQDSDRDIAPLKAAANSIKIDTSRMSIENVVDEIVNLC